jgi:hypothetical protein
MMLTCFQLIYFQHKNESLHNNLKKLALIKVVGYIINEICERWFKKNRSLYLIVHLIKENKYGKIDQSKYEQDCYLRASNMG